MTLAESIPPNPPQERRLPRRQDKVVAAPYLREAVSGEVIAYVSGRVNVKTDGKHGNVSLPFERFTWSVRRRAWVCWPQDVIRTIKKMDQDEPMVTRRREFAAVGEMVSVDGSCTWVKRLIGAPVPVGTTLMNSIRAYVLSTSRGDVTLETEFVCYDSERRMWIASYATPA